MNGTVPFVPVNGPDSADVVRVVVVATRFMALPGVFA